MCQALQGFIAFLAIAAAQPQATALNSDDWPAFRGPSNNGLSPAKNVPVRWSRTKNIKWKAKLPQPGNSSPIVAGDRVYVTCSEDAAGSRRSLFCFRKSDGKLLWKRTVQARPRMPTHRTNPYCASTPATDGSRVVVWHGSAGIHCYDRDGKELWSRNLAPFRHDWGYACSPIFHGDRIILNHGPGRPTLLVMLDAATGKTIWKHEEPLAGNGIRRPDGFYIGSWATPIVAAGQIICPMPTRVAAFSLADGKIAWYCEGLRSPRGDLVYSSPHLCDDVCVTIGGYRGPSVAVKLGGKGDVTNKLRLWRKKSNPQCIGSGVYVGKHLYVPFAGPPVIQCIDPQSGKVQWQSSPGANFWGSLVYAEGRIYGTDQAGTTFVFRPDPKRLEIVAENPLNERCNSTPAVCNGRIFIRTFEHLYCITAE